MVLMSERALDTGNHHRTDNAPNNHGTPSTFPMGFRKAVRAGSRRPSSAVSTPTILSAVMARGMARRTDRLLLSRIWSGVDAIGTL